MIDVNQRIYISDRTHSRYPAASSKDLSHTTSPPEVESLVEIGTSSPVPAQFLFYIPLSINIIYKFRTLRKNSSSEVINSI